MAVVRVRIVGVPVHQVFVLMRMRVRLPAVPCRIVLVLMMDVVYVAMAVLHRLVSVQVIVVLGEMQPDADRHQRAGRQQLQRRRIAQQQRERCAEERRH